MSKERLDKLKRGTESEKRHYALKKGYPTKDNPIPANRAQPPTKGPALPAYMTKKKKP